MKNVHLIGNAHLDPVWLWTWREGYHEIKATFRSALDRMNEFDGYVFTCACASYYEWVENNAPEMFEEIRMRVKEGQWKIVGGMWVQPDMNSLSGESIARHLLLSRRYFYEKFGVNVKTGYNVDTFGHNGQLPQILNLAGIVNYVWMRPMMNENANIPEGALTWEGIDGSSVNAFRIPNGYCGENIEERIESAIALGEKCGIPVMCFYGVGNHGGGPTKRCLKNIEAWQEAHPESGAAHSDPDTYFESISGAKLPVWKGELQHHASGCYSTFADSKMLMRKTENTLLSAEAAGIAAKALLKFEPDRDALTRAWKKTLFNQFHDLLGGCSAKDAMDDMICDLHCALSDAMYAENASLQKISWSVDTVSGKPNWARSKENDWSRWNTPGLGTPVIVFNPHGFEVTDSVKLFGQCARVLTDAGESVPVQKIRAQRTNGADKWDTLFIAKIPAFGLRVYWMYLEGEDEREKNVYGVHASDTVLENKYIRAEIDKESGELASLILKETGFEALAKPGRSVLCDMEHADTWAHNIFAFDRVTDTFRAVSMQLKEAGPARATIRVKSEAGKNTLIRDYSLTAEGKQIEVSAKINMASPYRLFKIGVCPNAESMKTLTEIPFGAIERKTNGDEDPCQGWIAGYGEKGGAAMINAGAYSSSAKDGEIMTSFVNTSAFADHYGQAERDDDMEFMQMGETKFRYAVYPFEGCVSESGVSKAAAVFNKPLKWVVETYHEGALSREMSGISVNSKTVLLRAVKEAENGKGVVLRLYESMGAAAKAKIELPLFGRNAELSFRPFEIKTLFVPYNREKEIRETDIPEFGAEE